MTAELHIPIHNEQVLEFWKTKAQEHGVSIEQEVENFLSRIADKNYYEDKLSSLRNKIKNKCGTLPDSTQLIREDRDKWA